MSVTLQGRPGGRGCRGGGGTMTKTFSSSENEILPTRLAMTLLSHLGTGQKELSYLSKVKSQSPPVVASERPGPTVKRRRISQATPRVSSSIQGEKHLHDSAKPRARAEEGAADAHPVRGPSHLPCGSAGLRPTPSPPSRHVRNHPEKPPGHPGCTQTHLELRSFQRHVFPRSHVAGRPSPAGVRGESRRPPHLEAPRCTSARTVV